MIQRKPWAQWPLQQPGGWKPANNQILRANSTGRRQVTYCFSPVSSKRKLKITMGEGRAEAHTHWSHACLGQAMLPVILV